MIPMLAGVYPSPFGLNIAPSLISISPYREPPQTLPRHESLAAIHVKLPSMLEVKSKE